MTPTCRGLLLVLVGLAAACQTDVPTAGRDVWGRDEGELTVIPIGATLTEIVADAQRRRLYATDFDNGQLYVIDATEARVERRLTIGSRPSDLSLAPDGAQLFVALSGGSEVAVIDLQTLQREPSIHLSFSPAYVAVSAQLYATSILEFWKGFTTYGQTYRIDGSHEQLLDTIGLLEVDAIGQRLYVATHRSIYQYDISGAQAVLIAQVAAEGPILDLHLSADGLRLYTVSTDFFATPEHVISHGLLDSQLNFGVDYVEVFSTRSMVKQAELYTGAFPRAVTSWDDYVVVVAADSASTARLGGFAVLYNAATLTPLSTHRLVGTPTSCATIDPSTGALYVAVNNPYDIRERFGERQDLQIVPLMGSGGGPPTENGAALVDDVVSDAPAVTDDQTPDPDPPPGNNDERADPFFWSTPDGGTHAMVLVPDGKFVMGSDDGDGDEQPVRVVDLDAFFIDTFEVSVGRYRACFDAGACEEPVSANLCNWYSTSLEDHPINCVYWNDADTYCRWAGLRLPTEAEWEKAARGVDGGTFPWGEDFDRGKANYGDGGTMRTTAIDAYPEGLSPYGAMDMAGNVWDWVADWYHEHYYTTAPPSNPGGPDSGTLRGLRGGSHWFDPMLMRSSNREPYHPQQTDVDIGFRCARDAGALPTPSRR